MKINDFFSKKHIIVEGNVSIYLCGPTVYEHPHVGNMRPIIIFDIINKVLSLTGETLFIHNITDIDDKIISKAIQENKTEKEISSKFEKEYKILLQNLNIKFPDKMPRVSDHIPGMIKFISQLIEKGYAYEVNNSVYFDIKSFKGYSDKINIVGSIILEENEEKKNPRDFVIWKNTISGIKWDSPWGLGRPGWHTECSYFIYHFFGSKGIDIHGGGIDLKFPHHINEMAQYESFTKNTMSKSWFYIGHVNIDYKKMSKSENNFIKATDFISLYSANVLRSIMILTNAQKPINLNSNVIENSQNFIQKIENSLKKALISMSIKTDLVLLEVKPSKEFVSHLENNLDFGEAIKFLLKQVKTINSKIEIERKAKIVQKIIANLLLVGIKFDIKYNDIKDEMKSSKEKKDFVSFDKLREDIIK